MVKKVMQTEAQNFQISKLKNLLENPLNPLRLPEFVIHQNLDQGDIKFSKLARS